MSVSSVEQFERTILQNWATYFRCPCEALEEGGVTLLPSKRYAGDRVIVLSHIVEHTFAEFDPEHASALAQVVAHLTPGEPLTLLHLVRSWGAHAFVGQDLSLMNYLYPPDLPSSTPPAGLTLRQLGADDAAAMNELHAANSREDVDEGFVEVTHEVAFGCFDGPVLVAAASGYRRAGFMDIGVLVQPAYRRKGLGKAVVAALCEWSADHEVIAQYRHNMTNAGSGALARALNFRPFFHSEAAWLA